MSAEIDDLFLSPKRRTRKKFLSSKRCTKEEFKNMRHSLKMTQSELGKFLGLSEQSIARMEKGHTGIDYAAEVLLRAMCAQRAGIKVSLWNFCYKLSNNENIMTSPQPCES